MTAEQINQIGTYAAFGILAILGFVVIFAVSVAIRRHRVQINRFSHVEPATYIGGGGLMFDDMPTMNVNGQPMVIGTSLDITGKPYGSSN